MAHDDTSHPPESPPASLPNAPGLTSTEANGPQTIGTIIEGITLPPIPENVEDLVELPINPDVLSGAMPSEPICPKIPGVTFPEPPDPAAFGKLVGDKLDSKADAVSESLEDLQKKAKEKKARIKNPPSATDMMNEMATQVSSAAEKAAKALEKAAISVKDKVSENLAAEWDKVSEGFTDLESSMEAVRSGAIDLGSLGMDMLSLPGAALAGAFPGFKKASECLKGEPGSAEEAFNKKSAVLSEGLSKGRGLSATAADDEITSTTEITTDENGQKVKKFNTISQEDAAKSVAGTTKIAVPQSKNALKKELHWLDDPEKRRAGIGLGVNKYEFRTQSTLRLLTDEETERAYNGLQPAFVKLPAISFDKTSSFAKKGEVLNEPGDTLADIQAKWDAKVMEFHAKNSNLKKGLKARRKQEKQRLETIELFKRGGSKIEARWLIPVRMYHFDIPEKSWFYVTERGPWHPASYEINAGPPVINLSLDSEILIGRKGLYRHIDGKNVKI